MSTFDKLDAQAGRIKVTRVLPSTPEDYYGSDAIIGNDEWRGGEIIFHDASTEQHLYIQTATSGRTAAWKRLNKTFATTTTSTSTSTSSSSSSTSTSSSSTTTMP